MFKFPAETLPTVAPVRNRSVRLKADIYRTKSMFSEERISPQAAAVVAQLADSGGMK